MRHSQSKTQVTFSAKKVASGEITFPCTINGVTVLSFEEGGKLEEEEVPVRGRPRAYLGVIDPRA